MAKGKKKSKRHAQKRKTNGHISQNRKTAPVKHSQKKETGRKQPLLITLGSIGIYVIVIMLLSRYMDKVRGGLASVKPMEVSFQVILILAGVFLLAALTVKLLKHPGRMPSSLALSGAALGILSFCVYFLQRFKPEDVLFLYIFVPCTVLLYLVYQLCPREFFWLAVLMLGGTAGFWLLMRLMHYTEWSPKTWPAIFLFFTAVFLASMLVLYIRFGRGELRINKKAVRVLPQNADYRFLMAAFALLTAGIIAASLLGWGAALGGIISGFVFLLAALIFYSTK